MAVHTSSGMKASLTGMKVGEGLCEYSSVGMGLSQLGGPELGVGKQDQLSPPIPSPAGLGFLALPTLSLHPFILSFNKHLLDIITLVLGKRWMNETQFPASEPDS